MSDGAEEADGEDDGELVDFAVYRSRRYLVGLAVRLAAMALMGATGFFGLALIHDAERGSQQRIQLSEESFRYAAGAGLQCVVPTFCLALMLECYLPILAFFRWHWNWRGVAVPVGWGGVFAVVSGWIFRVDEQAIFGKSVMLVAGGFLVGMLTASVQVSWWNGSVRVADDPADFPVSWSIAMLLGMVVFLGGQRAFTDVRPMLRDIKRHRDRAWRPNSPHADPQEAPAEGVL